jgi:hypothetical protein
MKRTYIVPLIIALVVGPLIGYIVYNGIINRTQISEEKLVFPPLLSMRQNEGDSSYWLIIVKLENQGTKPIQVNKILLNNVEITSHNFPPKPNELSSNFPDDGIVINPTLLGSISVYIDSKYGGFQTLQKVQVIIVTEANSYSLNVILQ